jgi:hypothetical protein
MRTPQPENQNQGGAQDESPIQKSHAAPDIKGNSAKTGLDSLTLYIYRLYPEVRNEKS